DNALLNLRVAIEESGAQITRDDLPTVRGDPSQLIQLFQNLVANAIKFRKGSSPRVHIGAEPADEAWCFSVREDSIAIAPDYFDRSFVLFQRLHGQREYPGAGIGLTICRKIVERHEGRIWVESKLGMGSVFKFTLPRHDDSPS